MNSIESTLPHLPLQAFENFIQPPRTIHVKKYPIPLNPHRSISAESIFLHTIAFTIALPVTLLVLIGKVICIAIWALTDKIIGGLVNKVILPALQLKKTMIPHISLTEFKSRKASLPLTEQKNLLPYIPYFEKQALFANPKNQLSSLKLKTPDGIKLDAAITWHQKADYEAWQKGASTMKNFKNKKWVILFIGNTMCYEQVLKLVLDEKIHYQANALLFNYRGVMESDGSPNNAEDLILDGHTAIQFLKDHGVHSKDILIEGYSIGGGIGVQAAALHPDVNFANISSYSSIANFVENLTYHHILGDVNTASRCRKVMATIISFIVKWILKGVLWVKHWEMDSIAAWKKIKGFKWIITCTADEIMKGNGKFYNGLKDEKKFDLLRAGYRKIENKEDKRNQGQILKNKQIKQHMFHHIKLSDISMPLCLLAMSKKGIIVMSLKLYIQIHSK
jgi:hypothetical protein